MPKRSANKMSYGILLTSGLLAGGGALASAAVVGSAREERRRQFREQLAKELEEETGQSLVAATLGRVADNRAFWALTLETPEGQLWSTRAILDYQAAPYDQAKLLVEHVRKISP